MKLREAINVEVNMSLTDTFLGWMRLNDDDEYDEDYDEAEEFETPRTSRKSSKKYEDEDMDDLLVK